MNDLERAQALLPPGRTIEGEYLRLHGYVKELGEQLARAINAAVEARDLASERNVFGLLERAGELDTQREILIAALHAAPWGSCRALSVAVREALIDAEATDELARELQNEIGVGLGADGQLW